jgi:hypothetical protein
MRALLAAILAVATPALAGAEVLQDQRGNWWDLPTPPARYFQIPYSGQIEVLYWSEEGVIATCSGATGKYEGFACTFPGPTSCRIIISNEAPKRLQQALLHHETAHCHGWPGDHPTE